MKAMVNVGLLRAGGGYVSVQDILATFKANRIEVERYEVRLIQPSLEGEDTFVAEVNFPLANNYRAVYAASVALGQDCIAVLWPFGGELIGPKAAEWGDFREEYFHRLEVEHV